MMPTMTYDELMANKINTCHDFVSEPINSSSILVIILGSIIQEYKFQLVPHKLMNITNCIHYTLYSSPSFERPQKVTSKMVYQKRMPYLVSN